MQFGLFYEHQLPRPWRHSSEHQLFSQALEQVELADRLGIEYVWAVEHHFLEEYSHSSAPEVFLAACSQRARRMRLGHGITLMLPPYNHPARVAERIATLDLISGGRVEWGTGASSSRIELEGFAIDPALRHAMWEEAVREAAKMLAATPYPGHAGQFFSMPERNVVPKPLQRPHPPLWMACSSWETIRIAARLGVGALTFAFISPDEAARWVDEYYRIFRSECQPIGQAVNPNIAMVAGLMCHHDSEIAQARGLEGFQFFGYALSHYYGTGTHRPGSFNLWEDFQRNAPARSGPTGAIGSPEQARAYLEQLEQAGVDQVIFVQQVGNAQHEHICASLELFAAEVLPGFQERHVGRVARKAARLGPAIEQAMRRVPQIAPAAHAPVEAYPVLARRMAEQPDAQAGAGSEDEDGDMVRAIAGARVPPNQGAKNKEQENSKGE
jgi:alkanesulfonate monooxygenase SsuD/methylene tetrahydromethanopterin reductase-like flavin-dependent oxidoreductase (luciferase family)